MNVGNFFTKFPSYVSIFSCETMFLLANMYLFKVTNRNIRERCKICSRLTIKTHFSSTSIVDFEQVNVSGAVCSCEPCNIFQNSFFTEHHRATASERN